LRIKDNIMFTMSNGSCTTKRLNSETASVLGSCDHITYSSECGWTLACGKDKDDKIIIAVHANNREEFDDMLNPSNRWKKCGKKNNAESFNRMSLTGNVNL